MEDRIRHLRIKIKNLADEARTIREEARKTSGMTKWDLNHHRTTVVRRHARENLLAYGLLRGVPYHAIERKCHEPPNWHNIESTAVRFGASLSDAVGWVAEARAYLTTQLENVRKCA